MRRLCLQPRRYFALGVLLRVQLARESTLALLVVLSALLMLGQVVVLGRSLDTSFVLGVSIGLVGHAAALGLTLPRLRIVAVWMLLGSLTLAALHPFYFTAQAGSFVWAPFSDLLVGSMLNNSQALLGRVFIYAVLVMLLSGQRAVPLLIPWVALLEVAQCWLPGRVAAISEPVWMGMIVWLLSRHSTEVRALFERCEPATRLPLGLTAPAGADRLNHASAAILFIVMTMTLAAAIYTVVRLPGMPYNLQELLRGDGSVLASTGLAFALLSLGATPTVLVLRARGARWQRQLVLAPLLVFAGGLVTLLLLRLSVTIESIRDVAGANNLYYFVVENRIWGDTLSNLFKNVLGATVVDSFERPVRFMALIGPMLILIAAANLGLDGSREGLKAASRWLVAALPTLWLCKGIAFDWSSTDNLNELIARPRAVPPGRRRISLRARGARCDLRSDLCAGEGLALDRCVRDAQLHDSIELVACGSRIRREYREVWQDIFGTAVPSGA